MRIASLRVCTANFLKILAKCECTVTCEIPKVSAISLFERCSPASPRISCSLRLNLAISGGSPEVRKCSSKAFSASAHSADEPLAALFKVLRMDDIGLVLQTKPMAPAFNADFTEAMARRERADQTRLNRQRTAWEKGRTDPENK